MVLSTAVSALKKSAARAAFINVDSASGAILRDCFKQFGIENTVVHDPEALNRQKYDAAVLALDQNAEQFLKQARDSKSNRRIVLFGLCNSVAEALRFSKYGVNVLLQMPLDRQAALRAVRSTHLLIVNEFRRYVRIPIVVNIEALSGIQHIKGSTEEVSGGGMSLRYRGKLAVNDDMQVAFDLPGRSGIKVKGVVCWVRTAESTAGLRFEPAEQPGREAVKKWIDDYLDIS